MKNMRKALFLEYKFGDYDDVQLRSSEADEVIAWMPKLNEQRLKQLKDWGVDLGLSFAAFPDGMCPASQEAETRLLTDVKKSVDMGAKSIWLDNFRWGGDCTNASIPKHDCLQCKNVDQDQRLIELVRKIKQILPSTILLGYFCVAYKPEVDAWAKEFDFISPMLYAYQFSEQLAAATGKLVVPILEIEDESNALAKIAWFSWDRAKITRNA